LFPLLFVHDLADGALGLVVEVGEGFGVVDFAGIDFWVSFEDGVPDLLVGFFQIQYDEGFPS
jgi:hypothetical protein